MTEIARAATIHFAVTFADADGNAATPAGATLYLSYPHRGTRVEASYALTNDAGTWTVDWESNVSEAGVVHYRVMSSGSPIAVAEGDFTLTSNPADPN